MRLLTLCAGLLALAWTGCGSSSTKDTTTTAAGSAPAASASAGPQAVTIAGFKYAPASVTVKVGTKVTWTNQDTAPHTATAAGLETGTILKGKAKSFTFSKAGTYSYHCNFHPYMHGTVIVR